MESSGNPFDKHVKDLTVGGKTFKYYDLLALNDARYLTLPFSIRVLLESAVRNCDEFAVKCKSYLSRKSFFNFSI